MGIDFMKGKINYFNAQDFTMQDVYEDSLLSAKEMDDRVALLRNKLLPDSTGTGYSWAGIMQYLDSPIDITQSDYIDLQILENAEIYPDVPVTMHIDLGEISEDFYNPGENALPDREDGIVMLDGILDYGEDVGLDNIEDGYPGDDPDDNYNSDKYVFYNSFEEYPEINGTEGNGRLDTEDLDNDGNLNLTNSYIQFTIDLDGNEFLSSVNSKGLKTYHIPADAYSIFSDDGYQPDLTNLRYMRIWFEYPEETFVILISLTFGNTNSPEEKRKILFD